MILEHVAKYGAFHWALELQRIFLDAVFPPKCMVCSRLFKPPARSSEINRLPNPTAEITDPFPESCHLLTSFCCSNCLGAPEAISSPMCTCCGITFQSRQDQNHLCGDCMVWPKNFRMARAAVICEPPLMAVIHRFKYAGKTQLAKPLSGMMLSAFLRHWESAEIDRLIPVPLHPQKFRSRGFNQSYLLIHRWKAIARAMQISLPNISILTDVLIRTRMTAPQTGLGRTQRFINVKGAFSVQSPEKVSGKRILVVDDVYTTGATVNECARILLECGAESVDVLTLARA
jgi:ComF family protein